MSALDRGAVNAFDRPFFSGPTSGADVARAWQFLAGHRVGGPLRRVRVAIIDGGFAVNFDGSSIGDPSNGASDFPVNPLQHDFVTGQPFITGVNAARCTGGAECPWHGHGSASVAAGILGNGAYAAGTGGMVADPILLNVDLSNSQVKAAIDRARGLGAEVINLSFGGTCAFWCQVEREVSGFFLAFDRAANAGIVMIAAAGNDGVDVVANDVYPCSLASTICVGALGSLVGGFHVHDNRAIDYSNFGARVDLFAPTTIWSWYGMGGMPDLDWFGGTSASAPFVAGVVAMMKSIAPALTPAQVRQILLETARTDSPDAKVTAYLDAFAAVRRASAFTLPSDRFEPNDSAATARTLAAGTYLNLSIDRGNDVDFFRTTIPGVSLVSVDLTHPSAIGTMSLPPFGRESTQSCGFVEQFAQVRGPTGVSTTFRAPTGSFVYAATSPGNPLPYHLAMDIVPLAVAADPYEPNDTLGTSRSVGDGGFIAGTLHTPTDVDFYTVYSYGSFSTAVLSMASRARVESSDLPLTIQAYDSSGVLIGSATSSGDCASQASVALPQGFHRVRVSGTGVGAYRLWLGTYGEQHPMFDVENWFYLILNPDVPISLVIRRPEEWFVLNHNSDLALASLALEASGLHMTLFDEAGTTILGEGVSLEDTQGQVLDLVGVPSQDTYLLRVGRTEPGLVGGELPLIPATLMSRD